ncbi:hypothetical protein AHF37_09156 [Paragonimus kellicotti]|nr:hypothetical protein AHF37_09156 [Paragonimus kellicotti]
MEEFLHDYGLIWVGSAAETNRIFDHLIRRIDDLNNWIGLGEVKVARDPNNSKRAFLKDQTPIPFVLYADGICLFNGPFRSFEEHSTMQFIQDILDGFFPSELQSKFPDGVPFKLTDKRSERFLSVRSTTSVSTTQKHILGGTGSQSKLIRTQSFATENSDREETCHSLGSGAENRLTTTNSTDWLKEIELYPSQQKEPLTLEELINRLPEKTVGKSGRIIDIRRDLQAEFHAPIIKDNVRSTMILKKTSIALRVRSEDGSKIYNLRMAPDNTVDQLYTCLDRARLEKTRFRLVFMVPNQRPIQTTSSETGESNPRYRRALTDKNLTLEQAGLVPRTMLRMEQLAETDIHANQDTQYELIYKQAVTTEDIYLPLGMKNPTTASCEFLVAKIKLPGCKKEDIKLDVKEKFLDLRVPQYKLGLHLPNPVDPDSSRADWIEEKHILEVTMRNHREFDFMNE